MCRQGRGPREHVSSVTVHAKQSPPGTEEKPMSVDAREVDSMCLMETSRKRWRKEGGESPALHQAGRKWE